MTDDHRKSTQPSLPRMALVGCGAAAKEFCLPVLTTYKDVGRSVVLVDKMAEQAAGVASECGIQHHCTDYRDLPIDVDAALITTPHALHAEQAMYFLRQGKPVFVEKPMGMSARETNLMLDAAREGGSVLMVNNCRRLFPSYRRVHELLQHGEFGEVIRLEITDGSPFEWSSVSDFYLRRAAEAKGVLLDRGAHTVDIVDWWLDGLPQVVEARHDAFGGAEATFQLELKHQSTSAQLAFSRLFKLENAYHIECEKARISGRLFQPNRFDVTSNGKQQTMHVGKPLLYQACAWQLVENFIEVVRGIAQPLFTAADVAPSIALIDEAYRVARPFDCPWYANDPNLGLIRRTESPATD